MLRDDDLPLTAVEPHCNDGPSDIGVDASVVLEEVGSLVRREPPSTPPLESFSDAAVYWLKTVLGVSIAGAVYGLPFVIIGAIFGFVIALAVSWFLVVPFALATRTLAGRWRHPLAGPAFGGTVGFISVGPVWSGFSLNSLAVFLLGPMATTLLGQLGGLLANRDYALYATRIARRRGGLLRFSMRTLLIATAWVALAAAALQVGGLLEPRYLPAIACWLPWQLGLLTLWTLILRSAAR